MEGQIEKQSNQTHLKIKLKENLNIRIIEVHQSSNPFKK